MILLVLYFEADALYIIKGIIVNLLALQTYLTCKALLLLFESRLEEPRSIYLELAIEEAEDVIVGEGRLSGGC